MLPCAAPLLRLSMPSAHTGPAMLGAARLSVKATELVVPPGGVQAYELPDALADPSADADAFYGVEREVYSKRTAKVFQPAKATTSSGKLVSTKWRVTFPAPERWTNALMGWTSTRDPVSNIALDFNSLEQATAYAEAMGCKYEVVKPKAYRVKPKSYSDNFVYRGPKLNKKPAP
ncbi:hypothetical protein KFE25_008164 [Diacronema lutheri]|uniref:NADH dehydrogenase [ubiquinone] iron-sulfur protein 4, mitochondrial n=2 Tax=Diacronema lutheri TaxID=2081491 RepID=A0A8J5XRW5_DIALT|nr:hypothetical protein KFE25_008164 [Diacronema lutheri]